MATKTTLFVLLGAFGLVFVTAWALALRGTLASEQRVRPSAYEIFVGIVTDFFDTLGIGSYATSTTLYRLYAHRAARASDGLRMREPVDDRLLPGTLNIGHTIPTLLEAYIFIDQVTVDARTLATMIAAATAGALLGAPIVAAWPRRYVQIGLGLALLSVCAILVWRQVGLPEDGTKLGLSGSALAIGIVANFFLGALMTIGVGLYAPCLVVVSLLGMNPKAGFPIMMGSCAFLQSLASIPFLRAKSYAPAAAIGLSLGGVPAVLVAAFIVKSLPLYWVKWLVALVVVYTAIGLLRAARRPRAST